MNDYVRFSVKGQVVIPKEVRDRYAFRAGDLAEVVQTLDGVLLRKPLTEKAATVEEGLRALRAAVRYDGPWVDEATWADSISKDLRAGWGDHDA